MAARIAAGRAGSNSRNQGQAGYRRADTSVPAHCTIRDLPLANPFYIYCANHPHRRREKDPIPIGPVYTGDSTGHREPWIPSPDTEEIRRHLLDLLATIREQPATEYPIGHYLDEAVVRQLGEFRDARAIADLRRLEGFNPAASEDGPFGRTRRRLIAFAQGAIGEIAAGTESSAAPE